MGRTSDDMSEGKVIAMYLDGLPEEEICRRTGYSPKSCHAFITSHIASWAREEKEMKATAEEEDWKRKWMAAVAPLRRK